MIFLNMFYISIYVFNVAASKFSVIISNNSSICKQINVRADKCHENSIMRSRLLTIHKGFASISQSRKLATKPTRCQPHMNELPVPCGPWDPWYRQKQSYFMKHLLLGLAWWLFSFGMAIYTESLYLNFSPPAFPSPPSDFVEECDDTDS